MAYMKRAYRSKRRVRLPNATGSKGYARPIQRLRRRGKIPPIPSRVFEETLKVSDLTLNADGATTTNGQVWAISFDSIPQWLDYKALYTQFKILSMKYTFMPIYNSFECNQALYNNGAGGQFNTVPKMAWCIQDSTNCPVPTQEIDVLSQNDCKQINFTKPVKVTVYNPQPETFIATSGAGNVGYDKKAWLDIDQAHSVFHNGIQTYVTAPVSVGLPIPSTIGRVYCKVKFALRDTR